MSKILCICEFCGRYKFEYKIRILKRGAGRFCSKECRVKGIWTPELRTTMSERRKGMKFSKERNLKISLSQRGKKSHNWKGDSVGYFGLHVWVKRYLVKPNKCQRCDEIKPLDLANISQQYKRDLSDWEWLCRKCHMIKDGRMLAIRRGLNTK